KEENTENIQPKQEYTRIHSVLTFKIVKTEEGCKNILSGCINRDKNSVLNMESILKSLIDSGARPAIFKRSSNQMNRKKRGTHLMPEAHLDDIVTQKRESKKENPKKRIQKENPKKRIQKRESKKENPKKRIQKENPKKRIQKRESKKRIQKENIKKVLKSQIIQ